MNLKDKVVIITGGSKGLGKALAEFFKKEESKIIICSKNEIEIRQVARELGIDYFLGDVTKEQDMINLAEFSMQKFGSLDIWVNNAGILYGNIENNEYFDLNKAKNIFDVNFFGVVFGMRSALKQMQKKKQGLIINIISSSAIDPSRARLNKVYAASKCAIDGYIKASLDEYKDLGVEIISIYPGGIITELWRDQKPEDLNNYMQSEYVAQKIIENIISQKPELNFIIKRPNI